MKQGENAFARLKLVLAAMATFGQQAAATGQRAGVEQELAKIAGGYKSRGKGGKMSYRPSGVAAARRARVKAKGKAKNKRAHKGRAGQ